MANINSRLKHANSLMEAGLSEEAIQIANEELDEDPNNPITYYILTRAFVDLGRPGLAQLTGEKLVSMTPTDHSSWINLGNAYQIGYDIENAKRCQLKAIELAPNDFAALNNLALSYSNDSEPEKALEWIEKAESIHPGIPDTKEAKGFSQLMLRQWKDGWRNYNVGVGRNSDRKRRSYLEHIEPVWKGQKGQTVVLYGEQGLGDEICFASVIPEMCNDCNLIIETQAKLEGIFKRSFGVPVYGTRYAHDLEWPENHKIDAVISMGQATELYRQTDESFTGKPYLVADPQKRKIWRAILDSYPGKKIGVAWNGGILKTGKTRRSAKFETFLPLSQYGTLVSLEYQEVDTNGFPILDFSRFINHKDYDETAALVSELDAVVCVTTAVADLCGALGVECHVLVPDRPHWRYYGEDKTCIWYNSLTLHRGNFDKSIQEVACLISGSS